MAQISDYTDYKTGTTSEEQSKLVETGKVVFSGKTTDNGDYETKSVALSELKSAGVPDIGTDTNRGKFLGVKENADELQWVPPLQIQNNDAPYGGYTSLIGTKSTIKLFSGLYYNKDSAGIGIKCDPAGGLVATKADGIGIKTTNSHTGDVLTMTADGIVWAAPSGGGGSNGQIIISYDEATKVATYNGQSITTDAAIALCNDNPNMVVNIFYTDTETGVTYPVGVAPLSRVYEDQGLMFSMQMFGSDGSVEQYIIVWATSGRDWKHEEV